MSNNMTDEQINKIAQAIAAKIGEPGRPVMLGCGDASSSQYYQCSGGYNCATYECGGAAQFNCSYDFRCNRFNCHGNFSCYSSSAFSCASSYTP